MRHVGRHAYDGARRGGDSAPTDSHRKGALNDEYEGVERRRVLAEALTGVEREQRHVSTVRLGKHAAGDSLLGVREQGAESERVGRGYRRVSHFPTIRAAPAALLERTRVDFQTAPA